MCTRGIYADKETLLPAFWSQENLTNVSIGGETEWGLYSRTYRGMWIMLSLSRAVPERGFYLLQSQIILSVRIRNWMDIHVFVCLSVLFRANGDVVVGLMAMWWLKCLLTKMERLLHPLLLGLHCFIFSSFSSFSIFSMSPISLIFSLLLLEACT